MTLQLPVEGGHEGGRVVVRHRSDEHLFDSSASSSSHFYLTASYSDCGLEFEEVTVGWRLAIVIGLTPEFPVVPVDAPLPCFRVPLYTEVCPESLKRGPNFPRAL